MLSIVCFRRKRVEAKEDEQQVEFLGLDMVRPCPNQETQLAEFLGLDMARQNGPGFLHVFFYPANHLL